jgi:hypothetical protein
MRKAKGALGLFLLAAWGCGDDAASATDAGLDGGAPGTDAGSIDGGTDAGPLPPVVPDRYCPGGPECPDTGDDVLHAGAAAIDITPDLSMFDVMDHDENGNGEFEPPADTYVDRNGNGEFDPIWIAGFGNNRSAQRVHDRQWARAIALRYNETTVAIVSVDCVGLFFDDVNAIRDMASSAGADYVLVAATHAHEAADTMGLWGIEFGGETGLDERYMTVLRAGAAEAVQAAVADLRPANIAYATFRFRDQPGGTTRYVSDSRDPRILDDEARILRFVEAGESTTIATLVNFASHPEYTGSDNVELSSDFADALRRGVESGVMGPSGPVEGVGGTAVFVNGALGGQIGPGRLQNPQSFDGTPLEEDTLEFAAALGEQMAYFVLRALEEGTMEETAALAFRNHTFLVPVENLGYQIAFMQDIFPTRDVFEFDETRPVGPTNQPKIRTEVALVDIGRARLVTIPGELFPEIFVGGYDGSLTPAGVDLIDPENENPPELTMAPGAPYLRERAAAGFDHVFLIGLGNDQMGYLIPAYDYELNPVLPYLTEAPGHHYEETNSVGPLGWPTIENRLDGLIEWAPE